jgi:uncharacterized protein YbaP (TraB family)
MNKSFLLTLLTAAGFAACSPTKQAVVSNAETNTLLWKISGKNLSKPSYVFGTMHMICANDIEVSDSLRYAIENADKVYLELDMDDMMQMMSAMAHMSMRGDTTLSDLLSPEDYKKVKDYFQQSNSMIPFSMLEKYKPLLMEAMVMENSPQCEDMVIMEQLIMEEAKKFNKEIKGLETMDYQLSIFDRIPYKQQAQQLVKLVDDAKSGKNNDDAEMKILTEAYRKQELSKMDELTKDDPGISEFSDILLYDRNANWANKLPALMEKNPLVIAVGAGHLPGKKGVLNLLREAGYKVEPVTNNMIKKKVKEI